MSKIPCRYIKLLIPLQYTVICPKVMNTLFDLLTFIFSLKLINIKNYLCFYVKYTIGRLNSRSLSWSNSKKLENPLKRYFTAENISRIKYVFQENLISHLMDNSKTKCVKMEFKSDIEWPLIPQQNTLPSNGGMKWKDCLTIKHIKDNLYVNYCGKTWLGDYIMAKHNFFTKSLSSEIEFF